MTSGARVPGRYQMTILLAVTSIGSVATSRAASAGPYAGVEYSFFSRDDVSVNSPEFTLGISTGSVEIEAVWGFAVVDQDPPLDSEVIALNPHLSATTGLDAGPFRLRFGIGTTLPVASPYDPDQGVAARAAADFLTAMHGGYNLFRYAPDTFGLNLIARAGLDVGILRLGADISPFLLVSTGDRSADAEGFGLQMGAEAILPILPILEVGLRTQFAALPSRYAADHTQLALQPLVRAGLGPIYAQLGLQINLLDGYGFAFDGDGVYGLSFGLGIRL